ncbi:MAG: hypothetical protein MZV70_01000 [Desulfobacterales bacterium]|nr:hypothetical protein [Desulfobacterales bacterium]
MTVSDFLRGLYHALSNDDRGSKPSPARRIPAGTSTAEHLHRLHAGSWINANFGIWIGHEEDNLAWDYLSMTRDDLAAFAGSKPRPRSFRGLGRALRGRGEATGTGGTATITRRRPRKTSTNSSVDT